MYSAFIVKLTIWSIREISLVYFSELQDIEVEISVGKALSLRFCTVQIISVNIFMQNFQYHVRVGNNFRNGNKNVLHELLINCSKVSVPSYVYRAGHFIRRVSCKICQSLIPYFYTICFSFAFNILALILIIRFSLTIIYIWKINLWSGSRTMQKLVSYRSHKFVWQKM